jgi:ketosteroid isomerase-like protein
VSQENVEVVREVVAARAAGNRERSLGFLHPEIVVDGSRNVFNPASCVGIDGLRRMASERDDVWEEFRIEAEEFIDAGDQVVVVGRLFGKGRGSGVEVESPTAQVFTVREGRVVRWEFGYADRAEAFKAVGLED